MSEKPIRDDATWAYLAGFVDGEGSFGARRRSGKEIGALSPRLSVTQTYGDVLRDLMDLFPVGRFNNRGPGRGPSWQISKHEDLEWLIWGMLPHLRLKKRQAEIVLHIVTLDMTDADRDAALLELKLLKRVPHTRVPRAWIYLETARSFASRSTCSRAAVGAVLVKDHRIVSVGYNGSPSGQVHCLDLSPELDSSGSCLRCIHAEANAILWAMGRTATDQAEIYCTHSPCLSCAKMLVAAGIKSCCYLEEYRLTEGVEYLRSSGMQVIHLDD